MEKAIAERLAAASWLAGYEHLGRDLLAQGKTRALTAGQWVQMEGDADTGLLAVIDGALDLYCQGPGDCVLLVNRLTAGGALGQSTLFGGGPRLVTAIAAEPSLILTVPDRALARIAQAHPDIWELMAGLLYRQLSHVLRMAVQMIARPPRRRVAARLLMLANDSETDIEIQQQQLGEMLGLSRKAVNAHLAVLEGRGLIERGYGRIAIRDAPGLARLVEEPDRSA